MWQGAKQLNHLHVNLRPSLFVLFKRSTIAQSLSAYILLVSVTSSNASCYDATVTYFYHNYHHTFFPSFSCICSLLVCLSNSVMCSKYHQYFILDEHNLSLSKREVCYKLWLYKPRDQIKGSNFFRFRHPQSFLKN